MPPHDREDSQRSSCGPAPAPLRRSRRLATPSRPRASPCAKGVPSVNQSSAKTPGRRRGLVVWSLEAAIAVGIVWGAVSLGLGKPWAYTSGFQTVPDAGEYAWVALRMAQGESPLLPIVNDLHPSRYSPVHPFLMSVWIRAHGGRLTAVWTWSRFALLAGALVLYLWLILGGVAPPARLVLLWLLLYSPTTREIGRDILQEPTMALLLWGTILCWFLGPWLGWRGETDARQRHWRRASAVASGLAGLFSMALACIRPTTAPLFLLVMIHLAWIGKRGERRRLLGSFMIGGAVCLSLVLIYMRRVAGVIHVAAYHHWDPSFGLNYMKWHLLIRPDAQLDGLRRGEALLMDLFGLTRGFSQAGWGSGILLMFGVGMGAVLAPRCRSRAKEDNGAGRPGRWLFAGQTPPLLLFLLSQALIQMAYQFWGCRFLTLVWFLFLVLGVAGLEGLARLVWTQRIVSRAILIRIFYVAGIVVVGLPRVAEMVTAARFFPGTPLKRVTVERDQLAHDLFAKEIQRIDAPLFVDRIPTLSARLLLGLESSPHPISQILWSNYLRADGHTVQFNMYRVGPPRGFLTPDSPWKSPPNHSHLLDERVKGIDGDYLRAILRRYGKAILYFPSSREDKVRPVLDWVDESEGIRRKYEMRAHGWILIVLEKQEVTRTDSSLSGAGSTMSLP